MTRRGICALAAASALSACAIFPDEPRPDDAVKDAATAIRMAAKACEPYPYVTEGGRWSASLRDGVWDVHFHLPGNPAHCEYLRVRIFAANGKDSACETCVITD